MSLETEVKKLTAAMVQLTDAFNEWRSNPDFVGSEVKVPVPEPVTQIVDPAPTPAPTPATTPATEPAAPANYTFENLNEILGTIAGKMGDQGAAIRGLMTEYNAPTLMQIPPEKYGEVIARAQALQS